MGNNNKNTAAAKKAKDEKLAKEKAAKAETAKAKEAEVKAAKEKEAKEKEAEVAKTPTGPVIEEGTETVKTDIVSGDEIVENFTPAETIVETPTSTPTPELITDEVEVAPKYKVRNSALPVRIWKGVRRDFTGRKSVRAIVNLLKGDSQVSRLEVDSETSKEFIVEGLKAVDLGEVNVKTLSSKIRVN